MVNKGLAILGAGAMGISSSLVAGPALAATNLCGTAPVGGTLVETDGICELTFSSSGSFTFTVPRGAQDLAMLLVGAGGGAWYEEGVISSTGATGYAGSGGSVLYQDFAASSANWAGKSFELALGEGGLTGDGDSVTNGSPSSATTPSSELHSADGGDGGSVMNGYCLLNGSGSTYVGNGQGAGGEANTPDGEDCSQTTGPGLNPSIDPQDNYGNNVPTNFKNLNIILGPGGTVTDEPSIQQQATMVLMALTNTFGSGASVVVDSTTALGVRADTQGASGIALFRWKPSDVLAQTGSNLYIWAMTGVGALLLGASLTIKPLRRRS